MDSWAHPRLTGHQRIWVTGTSGQKHVSCTWTGVSMTDTYALHTPATTLRARCCSAVAHAHPDVVRSHCGKIWRSTGLQAPCQKATSGHGFAAERPVPTTDRRTQPVSSTKPNTTQYNFGHAPCALGCSPRRPPCLYPGLPASLWKVLELFRLWAPRIRPLSIEAHFSVTGPLSREGVVIDG